MTYSTVRMAGPYFTFPVLFFFAKKTTPFSDPLVRELCPD